MQRNGLAVRVVAAAVQGPAMQACAALRYVVAGLDAGMRCARLPPFSRFSFSFLWFHLSFIAMTLSTPATVVDTTAANELSPMPPDWLRPQWPAPAHVRALCTTRQGGVSAAPWDSFNLGRLVGDDPHAVQANWARLGQVLQHASFARPATAEGAGVVPSVDVVHPVRPVYLRQVHGNLVQHLQAETPDGIAADASTTTLAGLACLVMAADCLPVLFTNRSGTRVAAAHAGWRGLAAGVLEETIQCFRSKTLAGKGLVAIKNEFDEPLLAWLGPCIGPQAFEVGAEVRAAFCQHDAAAAKHFQPTGTPEKYWADLPALARQRLRAAGVQALYGNDSSPAWCTVGNPSQFFSYRRDQARLGSSGRMAACIWMAAQG